jgi:polar amino acid transport system ATP-binding protein
VTGSMIRFDKVCKGYRDQKILDNLSFTIDKGETVVLMGPSGCGKTTILRCINGLEHIQDGTIYVRDVNITNTPSNFNWNRFRSEIGVVFQQFNLFPHLSVLQNITLAPVKVKKIPPDQAEAQAMELLERVGLASKAHRNPDTLSGGEKQRVAIARALAMSSDILLLDEPTSALDPLMTAEVLHTIQDLAHQGITLIIITHEVHFACRVADKIFFLNNGRIEVQGPPSLFTEGLEHPVAKHYFQLLAEGYPRQPALYD